MPAWRSFHAVSQRIINVWVIVYPAAAKSKGTLITFHADFTGKRICLQFILKAAGHNTSAASDEKYTL